MRPIMDLIGITCLVNLPFAVFFIWFVIYVLIQGHNQLGSLYINASHANLIASILSQFTALICGVNIRSLLRALRLVLARRPHGTRFDTFFGLGAAASWLLVLQLSWANSFTDVWCNFRLVEPLIGLALGSALKAQTSFVYDFRPGASSVRVFSGLIPIDPRIPHIVPIADQCQFITSWTPSLLTSSKYSQEITMDGCGDGCHTFLLPGGLEETRLFAPSLNHSMYSNGTLENADVIRMARAPGTLLSFRPLESGFQFDLNHDCVFGGKLINDSIQICVRQMNESIAVGWAACPQDIFDRSECKTDLSWVSRPMKWNTQMSVFRQYTRTTYSRQNYSIVHTEPISAPVALPINASDYLTILDKILVPQDNSSEIDITAVNALTYDLTWMHRTFSYSFPDDTQSLKKNLYNFLAVPQQFMITAVQWANYTVDAKGLTSAAGMFPMSDDLVTVATSGTSGSRLVIFNPAGYAFIAAYLAVLVSVLTGVIYIISLSFTLSISTGAEEMDILNTGREARVNIPHARANRHQSEADKATDGETSPLPSTLAQLAWDHKPNVAPTRKTFQSLRRARVVIGIEDENGQVGLDR
ncbi:hypothetical protein GQ53DRAFT_817971 [Thozetella sp. PMI_491]|nr:hypothetical protein GQ53DRAFT_817971 [Thozetella sp. PMI_491]